ncbi:MAG: hypothetical protein ACP5IT_12330 [Thermoproteota archaeon]
MSYRQTKQLKKRVEEDLVRRNGIRDKVLFSIHASIFRLSISAGQGALVPGGKVVWFYLSNSLELKK